MTSSHFLPYSCLKIQVSGEIYSVESGFNQLIPQGIMNIFIILAFLVYHGMMD